MSGGLDPPVLPSFRLSVVRSAPMGLSAAVRWLGYAALFLVVGVLVLQLIAHRMGQADQDIRAHIRDRGRRLRASAAMLLPVACALRLLPQVKSEAAPGTPMHWIRNA